MNGNWKPEYPGQIEPVWTWWDRDEPEDGLVGFHTRKDRDRFSAGKPGPFRRRISPSGETISQTEDWRGFIDRMTQEPLEAMKAETVRRVNDWSERYSKELHRAEAAEARAAQLEAALKPFAEYLATANFDLDNNGDPLPDDQGMGWVYLTVGDFRRARATLTGREG